MKTTLLITAAWLAVVVSFWGSRGFSSRDSLLDQPYSLTVEKITPDLEALCRRDPNCMDIEEIDAGCGGDLDCCQRFGTCGKAVSL